MPVRDLLSAASTQGGGPADPYFYDVSLLLNGDGTNGAQNNTFLDSSTNNFTITRNGNTTQGSFSPYGSLWSNYFDGSSYLSNGSAGTQFNPNSAYTLEGWFYSTSSSQNGKIFVVSGSTWSWSSTGLQYALYQNGSALQFDYYVGTGTPNSLTPTMPSINTWHHFAIGFNGTTTRMWIDGVSVASTTTAYSTSTIVNLAVGGQTTPNPGNYWNGYLSNIRFVKNTDVYGANNTTITVPTLPLTAISGTSLLTCQSNRFIDNSSNAFTLTVNGSPSVQRFSPFNPTAPYSTSVIGGSGYFDGSGDSLNTASNAAFGFGTGSWTLEAWVYPTTSQTDNWILTTNDSGNLRMRIFNGNLGFYTDTGAIGVNSSTAITVNAWNHLAICYDGTNINLYQNGIRTASSAQSVNNGSANSLYIGAYAGGAAYLTGYVSNARVVKGTAVYTGTTYTVPTAPVTAVSGTSLLANMTNAGIPDIAMMNNLETVGSAQVSTSVKKYGTGSLSFNGTTDYLTEPYSPVMNFGTGNFTVEGWIYLNSLSNSYYTMAGTWTSGSSDEWLIQISNANTIRFLTSAGTSFYSATITTGTWYHIAGVRNNGTITLYVNGTSVGSYSNTNSIGSASKTLYIGVQQTPIWYLNGYIDDFRITNGLARYTANFTPPTSALPTY
jgi:hypothetical protein